MIAQIKQGKSDLGPILARYRLSYSDVYQYLRWEQSLDDSFAVKARLMAALAANSSRPDSEINDALVLCIRLNPEDPNLWLRLAVRYAKARHDRAAIDTLFEAVRRFDLADPPALVMPYYMEEPGWLRRVTSLGRAAEFHGALLKALERTKPDAASLVTVDYALLGFREPSSVAGHAFPATVFLKTEDRLGRMTSPRSARPQSANHFERLLTMILERQQHLLAMRFDQWREAATLLDAAGHRKLATTLSRALLVSWVPKSLDHIKPPSSYYLASSHRQQTARWGTWSDRITPDAEIMKLFRLALRDDASVFLEQSAMAAAAHPEDEQVVSAALVAAALSGPLPEEKLDLARKLPPVPAMRVAWRLCELAPLDNLPMPALAPLLCEGIKAYLAEPPPRDGGNPYVSLALIPWVQKVATEAQIADLVPSYCRALESLDVGRWSDHWQPVVELARSSKSQAAFNAVSDTLVRRYAKDPPSQDFTNDWLHNGVYWLADVVLESEGYDSARIAHSALDLWIRGWTKFKSLTDISAVTSAKLGEALLLAGDEAQFRRFMANLEEVAIMTEEPNLASVHQRLGNLDQILRHPASTVPTVTVGAEPPGVKGELPQVHWQLALPQPADQPPSTVEPQEDAPPGPVKIELGISPALLRRFAGRYEVEIVAGDSAETFRTVAKVSEASHVGSAAASQIPGSGWLRGFVRDTRTGVVTLGPAAPYSVRENVLDTGLPGEPPQWSDAWVAGHGAPITTPAPVPKGMQYLVSIKGMLRANQEGDTGIKIVSLNDRMQPVAEFAVPSTHDSRLIQLFEPATSTTEPQGPDRGRAGVSAAERAVQYIVLTSSMSYTRHLPLLQVRPYRQSSPPPPGPVHLQAETLVNLGFQATSWHLPENMPRAAFSGPGNLAAFDTSTVPWRELARFESAELTGTEWPLFFKAEEICLYQPKMRVGRPGFENPQPGFRVVKLGTNATIESSPRTKLTFVPWTSELSPSEDALIFASAVGHEENGKFFVGRLDASLQLQVLAVDRPKVSGESYRLQVPSIAWWDKEGGFTLSEGGMLFRLRSDAEGIHHVKSEPGVASMEAVPQGHTPALGLRQSRWVLHGQDTLLRRDPIIGGIRDLFRLPVLCTSSPLWFEDSSRGVYLLTTDHKLVRVMPPPIKEPKVQDR